MASDHGLPPTHRALVLSSTSSPPSVQTLPTPLPTPGSAIVRILAAGVIPYMREIYDGTRKYAFLTPLVIGCSAIGRVAAVGADATKLTPGQLVLVDPTIRSRDDPTGAIFLAGVHEGFTTGSRKLMHGEWRDATFAEYAKVDSKALQRFGSIDAFFEISPPMVAKSNYIETAILALRPEGRVSLMGGIQEEVPLPISAIMHCNLLLKGTWMCKREVIVGLIKLVEAGVLKLGESSGV